MICACGALIPGSAFEFSSASVMCSGCGSTITRDALAISARRGDRETVEEARYKLRASIEKGGTCTVCGQFAKQYRRKLSSIMACWLVAFRRATRHEAHADYGVWVHVDTASIELKSITSLRSGDYGKLRFWNLLEPREPSEEEHERSRTSGVWRLTELGHLFVTGATGVRKYALVYNNKLVGYDGPSIDVHSALGSKFSYADLMKV